jgi:hypothetical protein
MEGKTLADVQEIGCRFDYYCGDVYAWVSDFYQGGLGVRSLRLIVTMFKI